VHQRHAQARHGFDVTCALCNWVSRLHTVLHCTLSCIHFWFLSSIFEAVWALAQEAMLDNMKAAATVNDLRCEAQKSLEGAHALLCASCIVQ
jgi:hypothetical protein